MLLGELAEHASPEAVELARVILEQDVADRRWAGQLGPALSQRDAARLLGKSEQAVSKDARLLRIVNRDGRPVYPILQFDGRRQLPGLGEILAIVADGTTPLGAAAWLTGDHVDLGGRPVDALRAGRVAEVVAAAQRFAAAAA